MQEQYYFIGEAAGKIFRRLEKNGSTPASVLQKEVGLKDTALFNQSLGWLAREGKVNLTKKSRVWEISLSRVPV